MKNLFLLIALLLLPVKTLAKVNCDIHSVYCQIIRNAPKIDKSFALVLSNTIYKASKKYNIDKNLYAAILAQESMYKLNTINCTNGLTMTEEVETVCTDFGISQIHYKTIDRYGFDTDLLIEDLNYSVEAGAKVLSDFKRIYSKKEKHWWSRYNSSNNKKRLEYETRIYKYLPKHGVNYLDKNFGYHHISNAGLVGAWPTFGVNQNKKDEE